MTNRLQLTTAADLARLIAARPGETKLGQRMHTINSLEKLEQCPASFVLVGITEDIGIRANRGVGGATDSWHEALKAVANVQCNQFLNAGDILVLGHLHFTDLLKEAESLDPASSKDLQRLRELTARIDSAVHPLISQIIATGKIPLVIGGGHNNSYGNIRGVSQAIKGKLMY
ncbi:MAG: arginase family protein [Owenweeksia sp.]|nr:arginase family protein [Owenweeksia sp.]